MTRGLVRFHHSGQSHFITFSCYRRQPKLAISNGYALFELCLEKMRRQFGLRIYGYVLMPEHVHLLLSEPDSGVLADAIHQLKLSFSKRVQKLFHRAEPFWQARYHDRNVRDAREFNVKLRYLHCNPVKRGLVEAPEDWQWSSFRHYASRENGVVLMESEWTARDREFERTGRTSLFK